jgi:hypothetical protein
LVVWLYLFNQSLMTMWLTANNADPGYVGNQILRAAFLAAVACGLFVLSVFWHKPKTLWPVLIAFLAIDHWIACWGLNPTLPREHMYPQTEVTDFLRSLPKPTRIDVSDAGIVSGGMVNYDVEEWLGYDGLFPERIIRFQNQLGADLWNAMEPVAAIQYYLYDPRYPSMFELEEHVESGRFTLHATYSSLTVYKNEWAFPRAYLVGGLEEIEEPEGESGSDHPARDALFERMKSPEFLPANTVLTLDAPEGAALPKRADGPAGDAKIIHYGATKVTIDTQADDDAVLVLADAYYPGWRATVNGTPAEIFPAYYNFRGVIVPKGESTIEFTYQPASLRIGLTISTVTLIISAFYAIYLLRLGQWRE